MQTVVIIFKACSECEALAVVGLSPGQASGIFRSPLSDPDDVCMAIYLLDFSGIHHANPRHGKKLPPGAWAFRATPYATVHGATWANRIEGMPPQEAASLLKSLAGLPGHKRLQGRERDDLVGVSEEEGQQPCRSTAARDLATRVGMGMIEMDLEDGESVVGQVEAVSGGVGGTRYWLQAGAHWYPLDPACARPVELGRTRGGGPVKM